MRSDVVKALAPALTLALFSALVSALFGSAVPDPMPVHWGPDGFPDRFGSKAFGLIVMPALGVFLPLLLFGVSRAAPRREHVQRSEGALEWIITGIGAFLTVVHASMIDAAMSEGMVLDTRFVLFAVSGLYVLLGNLMPKFGSNHFIGIRTPWTLGSDAVWQRTQRVGGALFVSTGVVTILLGLFGLDGPRLIAVFLTLTGITASSSIVYSWVIWREGRRR